MTWDFIITIGPSFKHQIFFLQSIGKKLRFVFRQRNVINKGSELLLIKYFLS